MEPLLTGNRQYQLHRFPLKADDRLRAWDAADEYILREVADLPCQKPLLVNDAFGALGVALQDCQPTSWGDSFIAWQALRYNWQLNHPTGPEPTFVPADTAPKDTFDLVLVKLPRSLAFFEDQLLRLRPLLRPGARVITGGMIKHTPARAYALLDEIIGPTTTTLGWKKSRLAHSVLAEKSGLAAKVAPVTYEVPSHGLTMCNLPNVFSRERLDKGTRLLLDNLPQLAGAKQVVDLGCGNGVLAIALARKNPGVEVLGVDESFQAIASARLSAAALGPDQHRLVFVASDGLDDEPQESRDLVLCNPPFHQGAATGDLPAWNMFTGARRVLRPDGNLLVVGNRHLGYHAKLKRLFDQVEMVASDAKFVVLRATPAARSPRPPMKARRALPAPPAKIP